MEIAVFSISVMIMIGLYVLTIIGTHLREVIKLLREIRSAQDANSLKTAEQHYVIFEQLQKLRFR